ncbi:MAG: ATP-dependent sacrificial sulfur transferase LarE [Thermoplasmatota archaeon]
MADLSTLIDIIREKGRIAVAYSGGRDSTLVALASVKAVGRDVMLIMAVNETIPRRDIEDAGRTARLLGLELKEVGVDVLKDPDFVSNPVKRCGLCKRRIMSVIIEEASRSGIETVADGAVIDDLEDYRPGHAEADKMGIWHPLIETGITKDDVERILKTEGIPIWNKPASPCLASRIPFGQKITSEKLEIVDKIETAVSELGFRQVRLRLYEISEAKYFGIIEVDDIDRAVSRWGEIVGSAGDLKIALDPLGYRTGSLHEGLIKD